MGTFFLDYMEVLYSLLLHIYTFIQLMNLRLFIFFANNTYFTVTARFFSSEPLRPLQQQSAPASPQYHSTALPPTKDLHVTPSRVQEAHLGNKTTPSPPKQEMMLKSGGYYCPMNREPLSHREETRVLNKPNSTSTGIYHNNNKFEGGVRRHNETTVTEPGVTLIRASAITSIFDIFLFHLFDVTIPDYYHTQCA
ncbi:hypothetical protein CAEBREN_29248 [Caenorhabditis brenneri]|uniref:Uncharacterized protein n=1 Tax=Caenorhabditis brenneri TaxID=135651 RepID=G0NUH6_CAEBE|nr:hypothetical protein CAEBREN_29248 [Caenorhabditis brenneri]